MCTINPENEAIILDVRNACLWRNAQRLPLKPKESAVLYYLATHPNQLVTKSELLQAVWPETFVSDTVLRNAIRSLRRLLGDSARTPQFIETKPRQGYRLIGPITPHHQLDSDPHTDSANLQLGLPPWLVGRDTAGSQLQQWLASSTQSKRCVGVITGEVGIGKTALVDTFLAWAEQQETLCILRGQCVEHYGTGEAYLPIFEALYRECQGPNSQAIVSVLHQYAPSWLWHMPGILPAETYEELARLHAGAPPVRMMRELVEALDALSAIQPLVFVVEDLHWSDTATLDLLAVLAQRREPARFLLLLTYRPEDLHPPDHPLHAAIANWQRLPHIHLLPLTELTAEDTVTYLQVRCSLSAELHPLARQLYHRTSGNPLFLTTLVDHLMDQDILQQQNVDWTLQANWEQHLESIPPTIRDIIAHRKAQCGPEAQHLLVVASVAGTAFSAATIAAGIQDSIVATEVRCDQLVQHGFLIRENETKWADGTIATRYRFRHALYQTVLYNQISAALCAQLHLHIGQRLETGYGDQAQEIAAQLARHFEHGQDALHAVHYHHLAAQNAIRKNGFSEALHHANAGLALFTQLPDTPERTDYALRLYLVLGTALQTLKGYASPDVEYTYARARELSSQASNPQLHFQALQGLFNFYLVRGIMSQAHTLGQEIYTCAQSTPTLKSLPESILPLGLTSFFQGNMTTALDHLNQGTKHYHPQQHRPHAFLYGQDPGIYGHSYTALTLWQLGYPDQALQKTHEALALAQEQLHPYSLAMALSFAAVLHHQRREWRSAEQRAEALLQLSTEHGFQQWISHGKFLQGWALAQQGRVSEGLAQMSQSLAARQRAGAGLALTYYLAIIAEIYGNNNQATEGLRVLDEALTIIAADGERWWAPEIYRLKGELLHLASPHNLPPRDHPTRTHPNPRSQTGHRQQTEQTPEQWFEQALNTARRQQAKSLALRAAMSWSRWRQQQNTPGTGSQLIRAVYNDFTEGFDTPDLREATQLLATLEATLKPNR